MATKAQNEALEAYSDALDESSWLNLSEAYPGIAEAMAGAVAAGVSPAQIQARTLRAGHSPELARWCRSAAQYLAGQNDE